MIPTKRFVFRFSDIEVHEHELRATRGGEALELEPKAFRVLVYLIKHAGHLVSKSELIEAVWGETAVTDNSLTRVIALLRRVLEDDSRQPRYIETVTTVGYRWVCTVERMDDPSAVETVPTSTSAGESSEEKTSEATTAQIAGSRPRVSGKVPWVWIGGIATAVLLAGVFWYLTRPLAPPRVAAYTQLTFDGAEKDLGATDGSRIYFARNGTLQHKVFQVSVSGGDIAEIPIRMTNAVGLEDLTPDGSDFLVFTDAHLDAPDRTQWIVRALDGVPVRQFPSGSWPAISPQGNSVVYVTHDGNIWIAGIDGTGARKIASQQGDVGWFAWSPDGGRIRFEKGDHIWEIRSDGSNLHQLLTDWHDTPWQCCGRWTADGSFYVFRRPGSVSSEIWALDERRGILRRPPSTPIRLASGPTDWTGVLPAKDAKTLYATGVIPRGELMRFDSRTQQFQPFLGGISALGPKFSPDGKYVVYVTFPDGRLVRANSDGSDPVPMTDVGMFSPVIPTWSPDGTQILFTDGWSRKIYLIPSSGGSAHRLIPDDNEPEGDPTWSPDGTKIAFCALTQPHLRVMDLTTHAVSDLPGSIGLYGSKWSPDGRYIAAETSDFLTLKLFDTVKRKWISVAKTLYVNHQTWSHDGQWLYFFDIDSQDRWSVQRLHVPEGKPELVAAIPGKNAAGWWGWFGLDPMDSPLIMRDIGRHEIYALTLGQ
jgi:DNA-binding winged helix-turn-helix (wHTH) protein/Tol biopolymer transport system component